MRRVAAHEMQSRIDAVLQMVQLTGMDARFPRELSGGQQQRVALARALVIEPSVLLLDEPLANLDASLRDDMRFFIRDLQQRVGITSIYVTHDQSEAIVMSDRIVVMFDGQMAQVGTPRMIHDKARQSPRGRICWPVQLHRGQDCRTGVGRLAGNRHALWDIHIRFPARTVVR